MLGTRDDSNANGREAMSQDNMPQQVVVKDIRMTFGSMVIFMIKWSIAAIPARAATGFPPKVLKYSMPLSNASAIARVVATTASGTSARTAAWCITRIRRS